ncbi:protein of unknown function [Saccharopolyspora antimicrobica]|uniref:Uncharacterized protein DUF2017 n=1 Tax=Saccharopolyspora antimicrobica TaxID=455193 RepID=A0A1I4RP51_9PSEU|nr:DUF2017 family protein [Saccharopolyspora antimicrobica]RKT87932.1 uncharacterized protein DUF2017 [Saccharopolyspora antimicrobica]SFM53984.1 protein of unknown function [Saccharopolyspora antimicrobica]
MTELPDHDFFAALPTNGGIAVRMADNVATVLAHHADRLIAFLERGELDKRRSGPFRRVTTESDVLRRMFPDAYRDSSDSEAFRVRHENALRDSAAAHRVRDRLRSGSTFVVPEPEVDDWIVTYALARYLIMDRRSRRPGMEFWWMNYVCGALIEAVLQREFMQTGDWEFRRPAPDGG